MSIKQFETKARPFLEFDSTSESGIKLVLSTGRIDDAAAVSELYTFSNAVIIDLDKGGDSALSMGFDIEDEVLSLLMAYTTASQEDTQECDDQQILISETHRPELEKLKAVLERTIQKLDSVQYHKG